MHSASDPIQSTSVGSSAIGLPQAEVEQLQLADAEFVARVPIAFARRHGILGLASSNGHLPLAICSWQQMEQAEAVGRLLGRAIRPVLAQQSQIAAAINHAYQQQNVEVDGVLGNLDRDEVLDQVRAIEKREDLLDSSSRAPVIKLVNLVLFEAVRQEASDVHIQPYEDHVIVRIRVDGVLFNAFELPKSVQEEMVSRVKVMGKMDIAEKRLPQDGRATVQVGERIIDLRIASLPTSFGERLVIRLLDKSARLYQLDDLGIDGTMLARFRRLISREHGLILVTGPTGSGKTTTLYGAMLEMDGLANNILTLEDPIEYQLPGMSQTQVSTKKGMTFAGGLRSVLRQDPDIIMVGEIRDRETASITIQSALTGHLVFSTLHTNDAAGAIARLLDLGIEPYLAASSVAGVLAQRLVRRTCPDCAQGYELSDADWAKLQISPRPLPHGNPRRGVGCEKCRQTGYRGRIGLFELLTIDEAVRAHISQRATAAQIHASARSNGMKSLLDDGLEKIAAGITTPEEVARMVAVEMEQAMGIFAYKATLQNRAVRGTISADSPLHARERLRAQGLRLRDLCELHGKSTGTTGRDTFSWRQRPEAKVTAFCQELATLLGAGIPLLESLDAISSQYRGHFGSYLLLLREKIAAGMSLSDALRQQPRIFDDLCISMVDVGEKTGMLDRVLSQLAAYRRRSEQLKGRVGTAMIYPFIVVCAGVAVTVFLCTFVVPRLLETLAEAGRPLPLTTQIVKGFSDLLLSYGWAAALALVGLVVATALALRRPRVRWLWHRLQLRIPLLGKLVRLQAVVRVAVMLATLTRSGMEFVEALGLVANAMPNLVLQDTLKRCQAAIAAGRDIGPALAATGAFPEPVIRIMEVGQATGHLDEMLERLAADYDQQAQTATTRLVAILEPAMILLLAGFIGFIVLSVILPYLEAGNVL